MNIGQEDGVYCYSACPTGYVANIGDTCSLISDPAVSLNFNIPSGKYTNLGSGDVTIRKDTKGNSDIPIPVKNRGIYFDGKTTGYITIEGMMINPSFSIHSWIVIEIDAKMTLFTKSGSVRVYYDDYALMSEILTPN